MKKDTIAAIATPLGEGGIGIVRLSGPKAISLVRKIFYHSKGIDLNKVPTYKAHYGHIYEPETGNLMDEVIVLLMRAPASYTREDVVEIHCHGGIASLKRVFDLVIRMGARLAEAGEFTKRAFLNGRLDLAQAEAVMDIVRAKTDTSLQVALGQLEGHLSREVDLLQEEVLGLLALIEAGIDYPEYELPEITEEKVLTSCTGILRQINKLLDTAQQGKILREGLQTVIIGKPNVGKSSLLNTLLQEERALVTDIPGTTRDVIEELVNLAGIPLRIIDTAGIRESKDIVERMGIQQARRFFAGADLVLFLLDAATGLTEEDHLIMEMLGAKKTIVLINKIDIGDKIQTEKVQRLLPKRAVLPISVREKTGLEELKTLIVEMVFQGEIPRGEAAIVANARHKEALERAKIHLRETITALETGISLDLVAIDLYSAWESLGEITGKTTGDDLIERIFSDFCLGK